MAPLLDRVTGFLKEWLKNIDVLENIRINQLRGLHLEKAVVGNP
jgi:hypothetical protein